MSATSLDIGIYSIKAIDGSSRGVGAKVKQAISEPNNSHVKIPNNDTEEEQLSALLSEIKNKYNLPKDLIVSIPDEYASTHLIEMPVLTDAELATAIGWQAEQYIPIPKDEMVLEYEVMYRPNRKTSDSKMQVLIVGSRKILIDRLLSATSKAGFIPQVFETQSISIVRALNLTINDPASIILHMGASTSTIIVVDQGIINFVYVYKSGSQVLTNTLSKKLGLSLEQAEQYKRTYGIDPNQFQGKLLAILEPQIKLLISEIKKALRFYSSKSQNTNQIQRIILSGGPAQMPGLPQYINQTLNIEVLIASPFLNCNGNIPAIDRTAYTPSVGATIRGL